MSAKDLPGFGAWGALTRESNELAASMLTFQLDEWVYMLYQQSRRELLPLHANNALTFEVTRTLIAKPDTRAILYSLHSLDASPSVDVFKFRMGYTAKKLKQRVKFNPLFAPLVNRYTYWLSRQLTSIANGNIMISKAEGMLRFCLQQNVGSAQTHSPVTPHGSYPFT